MSKLGKAFIGVSVSATLVLAGTLTGTAVFAADRAPVAKAHVAAVVATDTHAPLDGETLFRAVVFGQGDAAPRFAELTKSIEKDEEINGEIDRVVAAIETADPSYFDTFADLAQSGDVLKVEKAFQITGPVVEAALTSLGYGPNVQNDTVSPQCIQVVLFAVAALVYAGAAILQVAAVAVSFWYADGDPSSRQAQTLTQEKWIAAVTKALA